MKITRAAAGLIAVLVTAPGLATATQGQPQSEVEGPPGPATKPDASEKPAESVDEKADPPDDETTSTPTTTSADEDTAGQTVEAEQTSESATQAPDNEIEGPPDEEPLVESDLILGLEPSGLPVMPEQEETKYGTDDVRRGLFLIGAGVGIGIFMPRDVNKYLEDWPRGSSGLTVEETGFRKMVLNFVPRVTVTYIPIEYIQLQILGEIGWAPKILTFKAASGSSDTETFHFVRYSPGALANVHLPVNANRQAIFIGGGVIYHWLRFRGGGDEYRAESLGYRVQLGYRFYLRRFAPEVFAAFDYVKGDTGEAIADGERDMVLEYTGGMVGGNFYFDLTAAIGAGGS